MNALIAAVGLGSKDYQEWTAEVHEGHRPWPRFLLKRHQEKDDCIL